MLICVSSPSTSAVGLPSESTNNTLFVSLMSTGPLSEFESIVMESLNHAVVLVDWG